MATETSAHPEVLSLFTATFMIGLELGAIFSTVDPWLFLIAGITLMIAFYAVNLDGWGGWIGLMIPVACLGAFVYGIRLPVVLPAEILSKFNHAEGRIEGVFTGEFTFRRAGGLSFTMEEARLMAASQTVPLPGGIRCEVHSIALLPEPGQRYVAQGQFKVSAGGRRRPSFVTSELLVASASAYVGNAVGRIQRWVRDGTCSLLSPRHHAFMTGLLIGDTSLLAPADRQVFRDVGVTHLLAVSGQHIMVLAFLIIAILSWAGIPPLSRCLLTIGFLLFYGLVTGGQPSVWRAMVMYMAGVFVVHFEANPGPIRPVALATMIILLYKPEWIHHIGFQLSFVAVLGIVIGRSPFEQFFLRSGMPLVLARYLAVCFAANFASIPLVAYHFGMIPLVSFLVNPLVVWSFEFILPMGIFLAFLGHFSMDAGMALAAALSLVLDGFYKIVGWCHFIPGGTIDLPGFPGFMTALLYGMIFYVLAWMPPAPVPVRVSVKKKKTGNLGFMKGHEMEPRTGTDVPATDGLSLKDVTPPSGRRPVDGDGLRMALGHLRPLGDQGKIDVIEQQLAIMKKRSLKSSGNLEVTNFPVHELAVESQTLFHRLDDLSREVMRVEPDRLLQAQVFTLALLGSEIMARIPSRIQPPPTPDDLSLRVRTRNRYLAMAAASEGFFASTLPAKISDAALAGLVARGGKLHHDGQKLLSLFLHERKVGEIPAHLAFRQAVLSWVRELIHATPRNDMPSVAFSGHTPSKNVPSVELSGYWPSVAGTPHRGDSSGPIGGKS